MKTIRDLPAHVPTGVRPLPGFPAAPYLSVATYFDAYADETARAAKSVDAAALDRAVEILIEAYARRAALFCCGNGGSAAIANHLQCDHLKGIRTGTDLAPRVVSLSSNVELMTAVANDISYEEVFSYQLQSQSTPGDVLMAISSSGRSSNIIRALEWAHAHNMRTIALTGFDGGEAKLIADIAIHVDVANYGIVEDMHQSIMHVLAQYIRQSRMAVETITGNVF